MSGCICVKDDVDQWLLTRTGLLEGDAACPIHGKEQESPGKTAATDLVAKAWSEVRVEFVRSLRSRANEHDRIAAMGGQSSEEMQRRLAEMGHPTYAQQAIAERALAAQVEALTLPGDCSPDDRSRVTS